MTNTTLAPEAKSYVPLKDEGETKVVIRTLTRVGCENCGEPADQQHTYVLPNARRNPKSSAYGRDDISWCSDHEIFTCEACRAENNGREPPAAGYEWCSTFKSDQFAHMFLKWRERPADALTIPQALYDSEINFEIEPFWDGGFYVRLGDHMNGYKAEGDCRSYIEALEQLRDWAISHYPQSTFAKRYVAKVPA